MSYLLDKFKMKGKIMEICDRYARNVLASLSTVAHTGDYNDLSNKPTIPSAQVNSDWNASSGVAEILNKPNLSTVATSGSYNDLIDKPTIPTGQVNSDWNANSGVAEILNKPNLSTVATSGSYNDLSNKPNLSTVATSGSYNDLSDKPTIPTVNNGTLTVQKNGTNVATFSANQSGNTTANITCEDKVNWTSSGNWHYYTDSANIKHLYYRGSNISRNFSGTIGGWHYVTRGEVINFPVTLNNIYSISGTIVHNGDLCGFSVQTYGNSNITLWLYSANTGTKSISICLDIVAS